MEAFKRLWSDETATGRSAAIAVLGFLLIVLLILLNPDAAILGGSLR